MIHMWHLTPEQMHALAAGDPGEEGEAEVLRECWHCGEVLGGEPRAEIYQPHADHETPSRVVHAEPCGTDLIAQE